MTIVAAVLAVALVAVVHLLLRSRAQAEAAWTEERRELITRIQRPEQIPSRAPELFVVPDEEPDESHLIGTIAEPLPEGE